MSSVNGAEGERKMEKIKRNGEWVKVNPRCVDCPHKCKEPAYTKIVRCYVDKEKK